MADIRINALATTAASTASDDFVAVDGSANGTRKLNAYSPTFGGNLTVSGSASVTGALSIGSTLNFDTGNAAGTRSIVLGSTYNSGTWLILNGSTEIGSISAAGGFKSNVGFRASVGSGPTTADYGWASSSGFYSPSANVVSLTANNSRVASWSTTGMTVDGNLTVSGTGGISIGSATFSGGRALTATTGGGNSVAIRLTQTGVADWEIKNVATTGALSFQQSLTDYATLTATGNFLIGGTTDGGQKLQVNGDSGFLGHLEIPADKHIYMKQGNPLRWSADGLDTGTMRADIYADSGGILYFRTNGTTAALNIDSSQNATFAGDVTVSGGNMGVGIGASASIALSVTPSTLTGNTQYGVAGYPVFSSAATAAGYSGYFEMKTAASAFTMAVGRSIFVEVPTIGAGSAITTQSGIYVSNQGTGSITNAYGIDIAAQSGATTTNIGLRNLGATVLATPAAAVTLATNSTMTFELTSNTSLTIKVRGTDGTTRSVALTLA